MNQRYKITLKPLEPYFFGGENTFSQDDSRKESARYNAISMRFPQQSALLGMLRKTLLIQNGHMTLHRNGEWVDSKGSRNGFDRNYDAAVALAGKGAFCYEGGNDLGSINALSPLFISMNGTPYLVDAKDSAFEPKVLDTTMMLNGKTDKSFILKGYKAKNTLSMRFISPNGVPISFDELFIEVRSVGIKKSYDGQSQEDAFFQKSSYRLNDQAYFTFYADFSQPLTFTKTMVTLGAENSSFVLEATPTSESFASTFDTVFDSKAIDRLVLASETLISKEAYELCHFALASRASYRQLKTVKEAKTNRYIYQGKSKRYYLFERGSVLYPHDLNKLCAALSQPHLQQVGLNHFITVKGA